MFKSSKASKTKKKKRNTLTLKYQSSLEVQTQLQEKTIDLQDKIIRLMEDNDIYQKIIIDEMQIDIVKQKQKYKKLKEKM